MNRRAIIATHHKTGTVWMSGVFRRIAKKLEIPFVNIIAGKVEIGASLDPPAIVFNNHSNFRRLGWILEDAESRILHLIRDPRDVIISGMHYHRTSRELWLKKNKAEFGNFTYQEKLNSLPDDFSRYVFEMQNSGARTIGAMLKWNYNLQNALEYRYEDLMKDTDMKLFTRALNHLGFAAGEIESCRKIIWKRSLFGRKADSKSAHIRSGKSRQWRDMYDRQLAAAFIHHFGDALVTLGYESDDSWLSGLRAGAVSRSETQDIGSSEVWPSNAQ